MVEPHHLDRERAAEPGEAAADGEGDHEGALDIDAETACHLLVVDCRAHPGAKARRLEHQDEERGDREPHGDEKEPIGGEGHAEKRDRAAQVRRHRR